MITTPEKPVPLQKFTDLVKTEFLQFWRRVENMFLLYSFQTQKIRYTTFEYQDPSGPIIVSTFTSQVRTLVHRWLCEYLPTFGNGWPW